MDLDKAYLADIEVADLNEASYVETIEAVISSLDQGDGAMVSRSEEGVLWTFKYGSVNVYVQLTGETAADTLTVWSPVLTLPAKKMSQPSCAICCK